MKISLNHAAVPAIFRPIAVSIKLETQIELDAFKAMMRTNSSIPDEVARFMRESPRGNKKFDREVLIDLMNRIRKSLEGWKD